MGAAVDAAGRTDAESGLGQGIVCPRGDAEFVGIAPDGRNVYPLVSAFVLLADQTEFGEEFLEALRRLGEDFLAGGQLTLCQVVRARQEADADVGVVQNELDFLDPYRVRFCGSTGPQYEPFLRHWVQRVERRAGFLVKEQ